jgi:hypothetical protein
MSAGMFYTDIFVEVAVPFPPCRGRIPVSLRFLFSEDPPLYNLISSQAHALFPSQSCCVLDSFSLLLAF